MLIAWFREGWYALRERFLYPDFRPKLIRFPTRVCRLGGGGIYGETPCHVVESMVRAAKVSSRDQVYELGCGRGRVALFLNYLVGCKVVGIDCVEAFIERAPRGRGLEWRLGDYLKMDLSGADVIYLYGTCLEEREVEELVERLPRKARVVTISYPLSDYSEAWTVVSTFKARFIWGTTEGYVNEILG